MTFDGHLEEIVADEVRHAARFIATLSQHYHALLSSSRCPLAHASAHTATTHPPAPTPPPPPPFFAAHLSLPHRHRRSGSYSVVLQLHRRMPHVTYAYTWNATPLRASCTENTAGQRGVTGCLEAIFPCDYPSKPCVWKALAPGRYRYLRAVYTPRSKHKRHQATNKDNSRHRLMNQQDAHDGGAGEYAGEAKGMEQAVWVPHELWTRVLTSLGLHQPHTRCTCPQGECTEHRHRSRLSPFRTDIVSILQHWLALTWEPHATATNKMTTTLMSEAIQVRREGNVLTHTVQTVESTPAAVTGSHRAMRHSKLPSNSTRPCTHVANTSGKARVKRGFGAVLLPDGSVMSWNVRTMTSSALVTQCGSHTSLTRANPSSSSSSQLSLPLLDKRNKTSLLLGTLLHCCSHAQPSRLLPRHALGGMLWGAPTHCPSETTPSAWTGADSWSSLCIFTPRRCACDALCTNASLCARLGCYTVAHVLHTLCGFVPSPAQTKKTATATSSRPSQTLNGLVDVADAALKSHVSALAESNKACSTSLAQSPRAHVSISCATATDTAMKKEITAHRSPQRQEKKKKTYECEPWFDYSALATVLHTSVTMLQAARQPMWAGLAVCAVVAPMLSCEVSHADCDTTRRNARRRQSPVRALLDAMTASTRSSGRGGGGSWYACVTVVRCLERVLEVAGAAVRYAEVRMVRVAMEQTAREAGLV